MAPVLKTGEAKASVGSNPTPSAPCPARVSKHCKGSRAFWQGVFRIGHLVSFWQIREDSSQEVGKELAKTLGLDPITMSLRNRGIKGSLVCVKDRLFWRCTATDADGVRKSRRVPLGLPANPGQPIEAESRVVTLAAEIGRSGILPNPLPWASENRKSSGLSGAEGKNDRSLTVSEALSALAIDFWQGKIRTGAAERNWSKLDSEV